MSGSSLSRNRVLVIGQEPQVLEVVTHEIAGTGVEVRGAILADAERIARGAFDLVAFGAGIPADARLRLVEKFRSQNPATRFLRTYAPHTAHQVIAALANERDAPPVDLGAYCERIGYRGPLEPTVETLRALQEHHIAAIPFEAIDVLLDRNIELTPAEVDAKLIARGRGGYCFEQNGLFNRVLEAAGFEVDGLLAGVRWNAPPGAPPPGRTHMVARVEIDGVPWLADVGFGSAVPPQPLRLDSWGPQETRHETYRVVPFGAGLLVQALVHGQWLSLYDVSPEPMLQGHFELANWYTSTHPHSHFRRHLVVARTTTEARHGLLEGRLTVRSVGGEVRREYLEAEGIERVLRDVFGLPVEADWRPLIERAAAGAAAQREEDAIAAE